MDIYTDYANWKFENFDTVEFLQEAQKAFGKNISLIRIDKEVVNC